MRTCTIVIPTYNKCPYLALTLSSLTRQDFPRGSLEVIVVNDGSSDSTRNLERSRELSENVTWIHQENLGRAAARNAGVALAAGDIIVFLDDDRIVPPNFISSHMEMHQQSVGTVASGYRRNVFTHPPHSLQEKHILSTLCNRHSIRVPVRQDELLISDNDVAHNFERVRQLAYGIDWLFEQERATYGVNLNDCYIPWNLFVTTNVSCPKSAIIEAGGFDEDFVGWGMEDTELGYRLYRNGLRFTLCPEALSYHQNHPRQLENELRSGTANYKYFCEKHPVIPVLLLWRKLFDDLTLGQYNTIVADWTRVTGENADNRMIKDYLYLLKLRSQEKAFDSEARVRARRLPSMVAEAMSTSCLDEVVSLTQEYINLYLPRAREQQGIIEDYPAVENYMSYIYLNNVGYCLFAQAYAYRMLGRRNLFQNALTLFEENCRFSQFWDNEVGLVRVSDMIAVD